MENQFYATYSIRTATVRSRNLPVRYRNGTSCWTWTNAKWNNGWNSWNSPCLDVELELLDSCWCHHTSSSSSSSSSSILSWTLELLPSAFNNPLSVYHTGCWCWLRWVLSNAVWHCLLTVWQLSWKLSLPGRTTVVYTIYTGSTSVSEYTALGSSYSGQVQNQWELTDLERLMMGLPQYSPPRRRNKNICKE